MKIDRLYGITLVLMRRERVTAGELAERFGVSVRTIHRDLEALDLAGIPIVTRQGWDGGVGLMPGFRLEGGFFTRGEMSDLAATLKGIAPILSESALPSAAAKAAAFPGPRDSGGGEKPVQIDLTGWRDHPGWRETTGALVKAIRSEKAVRFAYTSLKDMRLERDVEPLSVIFQNRNWYLSAWCRLRGDYRWFTASRIEQVRLLDSRFDREKRLRESVPNPEFSEATVTLRVALTEKGAAKGREFFDPDALIPDGGRFIGTEKWPPNEWLYRFLLGLGPDAEVLEPPEVREEISRRVEAMRTLYRK